MPGNSPRRGVAQSMEDLGITRDRVRVLQIMKARVVIRHVGTILMIYFVVREESLSRDFLELSRKTSSECRKDENCSSSFRL